MTFKLLAIVIMIFLAFRNGGRCEDQVAYASFSDHATAVVTARPSFTTSGRAAAKPTEAAPEAATAASKAAVALNAASFTAFGGAAAAATSEAAVSASKAAVASSAASFTASGRPAAAAAPQAAFAASKAAVDSSATSHLDCPRLAIDADDLFDSLEVKTFDEICTELRKRKATAAMASRKRSGQHRRRQKFRETAASPTKADPDLADALYARTKRDLSTLCPDSSFLGCLVNLDFLFPTRWNVNVNGILDRVLGLDGPTELDHQRLKNALLDLEVQEMLWREAETRLCHAKSKKMLYRKRTREMKSLKVLAAICDATHDGTLES